MDLPLTTPPTHPSGSTQNMELSFLCFIAASCQLSISHMVVYICQSQSPSSSHHPLPSFCLCPPRLFSSYLGNKFICTISRFYIYMSTYDICFSLGLTSLCMTDSRSIHVSTNGLFHSFPWLSNVPHLLYTFICWWTFRLFTHPGYCKQCCNEHWGTCVLLNYNFLRYLPCSGIAGSYSNSMFRFLRNFHYCSWKWLYQFTFPPTVQEGFLLSTPSSAFIVCRYFDDGYSDQCEVIPHWSFDLHFSNN